MNNAGRGVETYTTTYVQMAAPIKVLLGAKQAVSLHRVGLTDWSSNDRSVTAEGYKVLAGEISQRPHRVTWRSPTKLPPAIKSIVDDVRPGWYSSGKHDAAVNESVRKLFTGRMLDVLRLVAQGYSNARIATRLGIAEDTVKTHLRHAFRRVGAKDRAHLVHIGHNLGLFDSGRLPLGSRNGVLIPITASPLDAPPPRRDLSDKHLASCALFKVRECDCAERRRSKETA